MVKSQKVPSKLEIIKQTGLQPNLGYSSWNITLMKITPLTPTPPPPTHPSGKRFQKTNQYWLDPGPDRPDITRLGRNTKLIPTITGGQKSQDKDEHPLS